MVSTYITICTNLMMKMILNLKPGHFSTYSLYYLLFFMMFTNAQSKKSSFNVEDSKYVFFRYNDLKPGFKLPIYFGGAFPGEVPQFLPREKADLIPFSSQKLPFLLKFFSFHSQSPQAKAMEYTLNQCESKQSHGEQRCVNSLEAMHNYIRETFDKFGNKDTEGYKVLSTSPLPKTSKLLQNYTVLAVRRVPSPKMTACHMQVYPYAVFFCHYPDPENRVFAILVRGEDGVLVNAVANCHMNTTNFDPNLIAFRMLGFTPGSAPLCHFLPSDDLVWVPAIVGDSKEEYGNKVYTV